MITNWIKTTLGESCEFYNGKAHEKIIDKDGQFIVINSKFISSNGSDYKRTKKCLFPLYKNDIVMVMSDVPNGKALAKCYLIEENDKYSLNQRICAIRSNCFEIKFLYYQLNRHPYLLDFNNGENQTNLRKGDIIKCPLYIPPLPKQKQIVEILDKTFEGIDRAIANTEKNLANAREIFESYLNAIFTQKGDDWVEVSLNKVCDITSKLVDPRESDFIDLPHIGAGNIISRTGYFIDIKTAREEKLISGKYIFNKNMVLYSKIRPYLMKVGKPTFKGLCSADIYPLMPNEKYLTRDFLFYLLLSKRFTKYAISGSDRAGMPKVNRNHLFKYCFKLPSISEQIGFATKIDEILMKTQRLEAIYQRKLEALQELKQSILHKAFTGELTNPTVKEDAA